MSMPTFAFKTRTRTVSENCALDLVVKHRLVAGEPSDTPLVKKGPPPQGIAIILVSPLAITISGMLNGTRMLPPQLKSSCIAQHLPEYLRMVTGLISVETRRATHRLQNSIELGMETISDPCIAEDTGLLTCTISSRRLCFGVLILSWLSRLYRILANSANGHSISTSKTPRI